MITKKLSFVLIVFIYFFKGFSSYLINPGPLVIATKGGVWPKPQIQQSQDIYFILKPDSFEFFITKSQCSLLTEGLQRYKKIINETLKQVSEKLSIQDSNFVGYISRLNVSLLNNCNDDEFPLYNTSESYVLTISENENTLEARSVWGILKGLETFSQLLYSINGELRINATSIMDYPRYAHRGLLLDTSRHYIPMKNILDTIDALSYNKMNVFHWHITDDQSFPYQSRDFPDLSQRGAYDPKLVYSQNDVKNVIEYARKRGVRVIVEFDTPGHTRSWGIAYPSLLTQCFSRNQLNGYLGPMDPTNNATYTFLQRFYTEISQVFPDEFLHIGGDEVGAGCWMSNPHIRLFMKLNHMRSFTELENYFVSHVLGIVNSLKKNVIVWEEVFDNHVVLPKTTLVQVWKNDWQRRIDKVTKAGYEVLLSSCWYLDHLNSGGNWRGFYECEPSSFQGTAKQQKLVKGGEACMWGESIDTYNVESRVWPRASAVAEKLWSAKDVTNFSDAQKRLEEHTCRMNNRGIGAEPPNGPGFCI